VFDYKTLDLPEKSLLLSRNPRIRSACSDLDLLATDPSAFQVASPEAVQGRILRISILGPKKSYGHGFCNNELCSYSHMCKQFNIQVLNNSTALFKGLKAYGPAIFEPTIFWFGNYGLVLLQNT
jgi:hypothetical protein